MPTRSEINNARFLTAITELGRHPVKSVFAAIAAIHAEKDSTVRGIYLRTLVQELCRDRVFLDLASAIGELLVEEDPDQAHYYLLADAYAVLGKKRLARRVRAKGKELTNKYDDPAMERLVKERLALRAQRSRATRPKGVHLGPIGANHSVPKTRN